MAGYQIEVLTGDISDIILKKKGFFVNLGGNISSISVCIK